MSWRRAAAALPTVLAILFVVVLYVFVGSVGRFHFKWVEWWEWAYPNLSEGFLKGQVSLNQEPDPRLVALADPYTTNNREGIPSVHDASYYKGKFYLYFTPLPAVLAYIPVKLLAGRYPNDPAVGTLFAVIAFLAQAAFVLRALRGRRAWLPRWLWIVFAGIAPVTTFILVDVWMYEVAALCGMAFASLWAYSLLRFTETPTRLWAWLVGAFLALSIISRPTLIVLGLVTLFTVRKWRNAVAMAIPLFIIGSMYGAYNYARFGSPFETGQQYQLTNVSLRNFPACRLCTWPEVGRFFNSINQYLFRAPSVNAHFPFVALSYNEFDPEVMFPAKHEEVGGVFAVVPLTMLGTLGALLLLMAKAREPLARTSMLLIAAGWLAMLLLSTCAWITARYELDFVPPLTLGTILAVEELLTLLHARGFNVLPLRIASILLGSYSILLGVLLGFTGRTEAFNRFNPELFSRISAWFGP